MTGTSFEHVVDHIVREHHGRFKVQACQEADVVAIRTHKRVRRLDARVVDPNIDVAKRFDAAVDDPINTLGRAQVGGEVVPANTVGDHRELVGRACNDHDVRPTSCECFGDLLTDAL